MNVQLKTIPDLSTTSTKILGDLATAGSGSTGVACLNTNRKFLGIEMNEKYFDIAKDRIEKVLNN